MSLDIYITRLRNHGQLPAELISARVESGCTDCGKRLTLERELDVRVCGQCQDVFLREVASDAKR